MKWDLLQAGGDKRLHHCRALGADNWNYSTGLLLLLFYCGPAPPWQRSPLLAEGLPYKKLLFAKMWTDRRATFLRTRCSKITSASTNQCRDSRPASGVEQEWLLSDLTDPFFNSKMRSRRSYTIWVITFTLALQPGLLQRRHISRLTQLCSGKWLCYFHPCALSSQGCPGRLTNMSVWQPHAQANTC